MVPVSARRRWWALGSLFLGVLVIGLDVTILNTALPTLAVDLDASTADLQWIVDAFLVTLAALLLPAGIVGDRIGRKKTILAGLVIFGAACALATVADTAEVLIAARALMGLGAAILTPVSMAVIPSLFEGADRTRAIALITGGMALGMPLGPLLGGWLLEHYWWGSVFLINIPLIALALIAVAIAMPETFDRNAPRLQPLSVCLSVLGLGAFVYGVIEAPLEGWASPETLVFGLGGLALIGLFVLLQVRSAAPMVDFGLLRDRAFLWGSLTATGVSMVMMGALFLVPQYLQAVLGYDAFGTGLRLLPMIGGLMVGGLAAERLAERIGHRAAIVGGMGLLGAGCVIGAFTTADTGYDLTAVWTAVVGAGFGMALVPATDAVLGSLRPERAGVGSALMQTMRQAGGAVGVAVLGSIASTVYRSGLDLPPLPPEAARAAEDSVVGAAAVADAMGVQAVADAAAGAFTEAMTVVLIVSAVLATIVKVAAGLRFPKRLEPQGDKAQSLHEPSSRAA